MNDLTVFSLMIAREMTDRGFKVKNIMPNKNEPEKNVYYFERTNDSSAALKEIIESRS